jgi:hypothetical protein
MISLRLGSVMSLELSDQVFSKVVTLRASRASWEKAGVTTTRSQGDGPGAVLTLELYLHAA